MIRSFKFGIIASVLFATVAFPNLTSAREALRVKVFHESFTFKAPTEINQSVLSRDLMKLGETKFAHNTSASTDTTNLEQFVAPVTDEKWRSLVIEAWVAGDNAPGGYYFQYHGIDSQGRPIEGGAFIATDSASVKSHLAEYRRLFNS
jgi:hypothetical protein